MVLMSAGSLVSRWQQWFSRALGLWSAGGSSGSHEHWVFGQQVAAMVLMSTRSLVSSGSQEHWVFGQQVAAVVLMSTGSLVSRWQQ